MCIWWINKCSLWIDILRFGHSLWWLTCEHAKTLINCNVVRISSGNIIFVDCFSRYTVSYPRGEETGGAIRGVARIFQRRAGGGVTVCNTPGYSAHRHLKNIWCETNFNSKLSNRGFGAKVLKILQICAFSTPKCCMLFILEIKSPPKGGSRAPQDPPYRYAPGLYKENYFWPQKCMSCTERH